MTGQGDDDDGVDVKLLTCRCCLTAICTVHAACCGGCTANTADNGATGDATACWGAACSRELQ